MISFFFHSKIHGLLLEIASMLPVHSVVARLCTLDDVLCTLDDVLRTLDDVLRTLDDVRLMMCAR
jgi:hypothetical protein